MMKATKNQEENADFTVLLASIVKITKKVMKNSHKKAEAEALLLHSKAIKCMHTKDNQ